MCSVIFLAALKIFIIIIIISLYQNSFLFSPEKGRNVGPHALPAARNSTCVLPSQVIQLHFHGVSFLQA